MSIIKQPANHQDEMNRQAKILQRSADTRSPELDGRGSADARTANRSCKTYCIKYRFLVSIGTNHLRWTFQYQRKYKGDALLQKTYTIDFLTKKQVKNEGTVPQYYVTGNHEAIISPAVWDFVQAELAATCKGQCSSSRQHVFSGKIGIFPYGDEGFQDRW